MFKRERVVGAAWSFVAFIKKTAWIFLVFVFGAWIYLTGKNAGTAEAIVFQQNIGMSVSSTAVVMWLLYWWQMDSTDDMQKDLKELKQQNQVLTTLLQQLVDKANQPTSALPTPANLTNPPDALTTKLALPDQAVVASNGHVSNGS